MDRGAWWATVPGITSWIQLKRPCMHARAIRDRFLSILFCGINRGDTGLSHLLSYEGPCWADVCVCLLCTHRHPVPPRSAGARGIGMRGLTGKDSVSLQAMIPSRDPGVRGAPSQFWAWGQLQFLVVTWFPGLSGRGEEQGPESKLCSKPWVNQKGAGGSEPLRSSSHEAPLGADLGIWLLRLVSAEAQVLEAGCGELGQGQGWRGEMGSEGPDSGEGCRLAVDSHLFFPGCSCLLLLWFA